MQARGLLLMLPETFLICASWCHWPYSILDMRAAGKVSVFCSFHKSISAPAELWRTSCQRKRLCHLYEPATLPGKRRTIFSLTFKQFCHVLPVALLRWKALKIVRIAERSPQSCEAIHLSHRSGSILGHHWECECKYILCASSIVWFVKHASLTLKNTPAHKEKALKADSAIMAFRPSSLSG